MEARFIEKKDEHQIASIMAYCFRGKRAETDKDSADNFIPENHLGLFDGERLMSSLEIVPKKVLLYKESVKMGGIAGVTSFPEYRHGGVAKKLIIQSLGIMRERNMIVSFLHPFSYMFYRRYGWETAFHKKVYTIELKSLSAIGTKSMKYRILNESYIAGMEKIYHSNMLNYNGAAIRTKEEWEEKFKHDFIYGAEDEQGLLRGYIIYCIDDKVMTVKELICDSIEAKRELLRFIYMHDAKIDRFVWAAPADDMTDMLLDEPPQAVCVPKMMARAVDVEKLLCIYDYSGYEGDFSLKIEDPWAPWNNSLFCVHVKGKKASVTRSNSNSPDINCSIEAFSQMIMGYAGFDKQLYMNRLKLINNKKKKDFSLIFPGRFTELNDFF